MKSNHIAAPLRRLVFLFAMMGLATAILTPQPLQATVVSLDFSGTINSVADNGGVLGGTGITAGTSTFTGSFSYDTGAAAFFSDANNAGYSGMTFTVTIDGSIVMSDDPSVITISNDLPGFNRDGVFIGSTGATIDQFDLPPGSPQQFFINLFDNTQTLFSSTALPGSLSLGQFDTALFSVVAVGSAGVLYDIDGAIESLTVSSGSPIPEPGALLLFAAGFFVVVSLRRRRTI